MRPTMVVQIHPLADRGVGVLLAPKLITKAVFLLQDAIETLGLGVLLAVILLGHTDTQTRSLQRLNVRRAAILTAAI